MYFLINPYYPSYKRKGGIATPNSLSRKDSNLDKQNQNLLCYHYTTRQA